MKTKRYNPRKDKAGLIDLAVAYSERSVTPFNKEDFIEEIDSRVKDLKLRNSIVLAKDDDDKIIGCGMFSLFKDYFGNTQCKVHHVMTYKEDAFKEGIEEAILLELFKYLKNTMNINKIGLFCKDSNSQYRSLLMKLGIKKSDNIYYEHEL
ncbi:MAG: GNAT family N-acetyltransferase [Candidatus Lokiarchaeota archaeon]|nr:GNAT family N-acetyltransferase [Candidatus Lokiarchaeota archaeon]